MRRDIREADGNEVFWAGRIDENGIVTEVKVGARGDTDSVIVNRSASREGHVLIHNHPSGNIHPSSADMDVAAHASDTSLGFYIVNNDVTEVYAVVEPVLPKTVVPIDADSAADFISKEGPLSKKSEAFEERPSQIALLKSIATAFNENKIGVFEAGTGVGKSFAYLIPSMLWALSNKERIIISTGTINLQQQLMEKDIPLAEGIIGKTVKAVLLKGRQNYICLRRLAEASAEPDLFDDDAPVFESISSWAKTSETGSKSDLSFVPSENVWGRINSESDSCMGMRCQYREKCFVMKTRKEAADANILVVNHHLLFADIESRMNGGGYEDTAVLPPYRRIIFDEAHGIEDSATSFFSESINRFKLSKQLKTLYRAYRESVSGLLSVVGILTGKTDFMEKCRASVSEIQSLAGALDDAAVAMVGEEYTARLHEESVSAFEPVFACMDRLRSALGDFTAFVHDVIENLDEEDQEVQAVWETKTVLRRLDTIVSLAKNFCEWNEHDDQVFYVQKIRLQPKKVGDPPVVFAEFTQTPLDIAHLMNMGVFEPMKTVVCTSATIRTGKTFSYWMRRIGLSFVEEERVMQGLFESPFPYSRNVLFAVPGDAPVPQSKGFQSYVEETVPALVEAAGGRTLVLFTSYDSLRSAYSSSRSRLEGLGIRCLKQGDDDRFRLLKTFREDKSSVLFATDSFWEGVDVPGESLSQVVMVKLPFAVPNDPVFAARSEAVEKRGGSSFMELSVPQAVIKFRQGFGRLMRRSDDRGVIIVLDRRIVDKPYGKQFTTSVPMTRRMNNPLCDILRAEALFLTQKPSLPSHE